MLEKREKVYNIIVISLGIILALILSLSTKEYMQINGLLFVLFVIVSVIFNNIRIPVRELNLTFDMISITGAYFMFGIVPTLWLVIILFFLQDIIVNNARKLGALFNAGMFLIIISLIHFIFELTGYEFLLLTTTQKRMAIIAFSFAIFLLNWTFILLGDKIVRLKITEGWFESFTWDLCGNLIALPLSVLIIDFYYVNDFIGIAILVMVVLLASLIFKLVRNLAFLNKNLKVVHEISADITSSLDLHEVISNVLDGTNKLVGYDYSCILAFNQDTQRCHVIGSKFVKPIPVNDSNVEKYLSGRVNRLLDCKKSFIVGSSKANKNVLDITCISGEASTGVYQPLFVKNEFVGCILILSKKRRAFLKEQLTALDILAYQASIAIENAKLYKATKNKAVKDSLTGLYNQSYFFSALEKLTGECGNCVQNDCEVCNRTSLIIMDIDFFKKVNDNFGHQAGDKVLKEVAQIIKENVRKNDIVSRYGGEEFTIKVSFRYVSFACTIVAIMIV